MADRRYNDKEVGQILNIAAEMQAGLAITGSQDGVTLPELKRVAEEVGISPEIIERAARELEVSPKNKSAAVPASVWVDHSMNGTLTDEGWDELVSELRRFVGRPGRSDVSSKAREWIGGWVPGSVMLSTTTWRGRTRLKLLGDTSDVSGLVVTIGLVAGILLPMIPLIARKSNPAMTPLLTFLIAMGIIGTVVLTTRGYIRSYRKRFAVQIEALLGRLTGIAESNVTEELSNPLASSLVDSVEEQLVERIRATEP